MQYILSLIGALALQKSCRYLPAYQGTQITLGLEILQNADVYTPLFKLYWILAPRWSLFRSVAN